jgi:glutaredoxin 3
MAKVNVYSTPTCPYCKMAKEFLTKNKIKFKDINVAEDKKQAAHMMEISGQTGVPVIEIGDDVVVGFDKDTLSELLKIK